MRKLELKENSNVFGGDQCDRLLNRAERNIDNPDVFWRLIDKYDRLCT